MFFYCSATADILTKLLQQCLLLFIIVVYLGNSQVSVYIPIENTEWISTGFQLEMGDIIAIQVYRGTSYRRYVSRYTFYVSRYVLRIGPNWKFYRVSPHIICLKLEMLK